VKSMEGSGTVSQHREHSVMMERKACMASTFCPPEYNSSVLLITGDNW
jgi:hypothetical protein